MLFDYLEITDLIILDGVFLLVVLFLMFKWFFKQVRSIAKEPEGFIKFGQITFILFSWSAFFIVLFYYMIYPRDVSVLDIFLTIVVGFLGTSIGLFFSKEALERMEGKVKKRGKVIRNLSGFFEDTKELIRENIKLKENLEKIKKN